MTNHCSALGHWLGRFMANGTIYKVLFLEDNTDIGTGIVPEQPGKGYCTEEYCTEAEVQQILYIVSTFLVTVYGRDLCQLK